MPPDPALPSLAEALDPAAMRARFRSLDREFADLREVTIEYARYKPGLSCVLEYRLLQDGGGERIFLGRVCTGTTFEALAAKASATLRSTRGKGGIIRLQPDLRLILTGFPHDRAVKGMRHVLDPDRLKRILHRVASRYDPARQWVSGSHSRIDLVTYKPERCCLVRCDLGIHDRGLRRIRRETIYARIHGDATGRRVFGLLNDLQACNRARRADIPVPRPVGYDPDHRIVFFEEVPGEPMTTLCGNGAFLDAVENSGALLARLHTAGVVVPRRLRSETLLDEAREIVDRLFAAGVLEAGALKLAVERLRALQPPPSRAGLVCLHGDFHPGQILANGSSLHCVDFDETGMGGEALDLGYFIAHLRRLVHLRLVNEDTERRAAERFLAGYAGGGAPLPDPEVVEWHRDLTFLRMALNSLKYLEVGWPGSLRFYLEGIGR
ncbi:MAG: hypothetical protein AUH92_03205 [Acidobacteria bacterium 13_1_40CM_4_69_4]|nr:MAG: hypothetical protein AUH92_03205 [Acidobacteria bacterium 13_1_40CM_4_69_4]